MIRRRVVVDDDDVSLLKRGRRDADVHGIGVYVVAAAVHRQHLVSRAIRNDFLGDRAPVLRQAGLDVCRGQPQTDHGTRRPVDGCIALLGANHVLQQVRARRARAHLHDLLHAEITFQRALEPVTDGSSPHVGNGEQVAVAGFEHDGGGGSVDAGCQPSARIVLEFLDHVLLGFCRDQRRLKLHAQDLLGGGLVARSEDHVPSAFEVGQVGVIQRDHEQRRAPLIRQADVARHGVCGVSW